MNIKNAIIIEGERFPWQEVHDEIERKKLWEHRPEYAAAMADPGCCSCPRCHQSYWAEGIRQRCQACGAEYETNWWSMLSWGVQHGRVLSDKHHPMHEFHLGPYYKAIQFEKSTTFKWGMAHPDCSLEFTVVFKATDWISVWSGASPYIKEGEMVGGKVIGIARGEKNTLLHVQGTGGEKRDVVSVRCIEHPVMKIEIGDSVWWQAGKVMWTSRRRRVPAEERIEDFQLVKVGYSH